jgi:hypothetical protein
MNPHLYDILDQQRIADLQQAADHARLATDAGPRRRDSRDASPVVRALPMPTAHPSPEAWPAASTSPTPGRPALCRTSTAGKLSTGARLKAARVPLSRDQASTADSGAPGNACLPLFVAGHGMS